MSGYRLLTCSLARVHVTQLAGIWVCLLALTGVLSPVSGQTLSAAPPEQLDISSERLARVSAFFSGEVERGGLPGAVVLIMRRGHIAYLESFGFRDVRSGSRMTSDAVFRIYSMTKPVTSVALMMLVEEGRVALTDPLSKFLPQLKGLEVSVPQTTENGAASYGRVPSAREATVHDLLRHTSGFTYSDRTANSDIASLYRSQQIGSSRVSNAELVNRLAGIPLTRQPGTAFEYGVSTDVLGRLVEVVSGMSLSEFFRERILEPLGMIDSGFHVPAASADRLAEPLERNPVTGAAISMLDVRTRPVGELGGAGMVSTARDYARFCQMLLNGGELDGVRLLSPSTVSWMTSDHLGSMISAAPTPSDVIFGTPGYTFGLGVAVRESAGIAGVPGSAGEYTWAGAGGTYFFVDPSKNLVAILMAATPGPERVEYRRFFRQLVYQALLN